MLLNLNNCFPQARDGSQKPLPKQQEFLSCALDLKVTAPKYIRYCGGVGSGKTLIGCVTVLSWAIMYPGDYLICRQFMPELKLTTLKTFLDICPKELIAEHRIADSIIRIKCVGGGYSNIIFRGLEEPDKHRSLNLNGAYIDEANQTTEEAFTLLQGRLRGKHVRKIILTTNSGGRDWGWRLFVDKSDFVNEVAKKMFHSIKAPSTENVHLPEGYVESMMSTWSEDRIKREIMADEDSFEGQVYPEFKRHLHVVKPFRIPDHWERHMRIDHGFRNPTSVHFYAIGPDGEVYVYDEFYESEWLVSEVILGKKMNATNFPGILDKAKNTKFVSAKIDPSVKNRSAVSGTSVFDEYYRHWPRKWPMLTYAKNDVDVGIDRVKSYLKPHPKTGQPLLFIFEHCKEMINEIQSYRYPQLKAGQEGLKSEQEKPMKVNDHAMDDLRYMVVDLPDPSAATVIKAKPKNATLERSLMSDIEGVHNPPARDPFTSSGGF